MTDPINVDLNDIPKEIERLTAQMKIAAKNLDFESAIKLRETISQLKKKAAK